MRNLLPRLGFIDETALQKKRAKATGWSPKDARLIGYAPFGHWNIQTIIAALCRDQLDAPWVIDGPMTREMLDRYVKTQLAPPPQLATWSFLAIGPIWLDGRMSAQLPVPRLSG